MRNAYKKCSEREGTVKLNILATIELGRGHFIFEEHSFTGACGRKIVQISGINLPKSRTGN